MATLPDSKNLDLNVVALARAIRHNESGGKYDARGKSGEGGAYQFMPAVWKEWAARYIGDKNAPQTPENQNAVAYLRVKERKELGLTPAQILSEWNSGSTSWQGKKGKNKYGADYDVPLYVENGLVQFAEEVQALGGKLPSASAAAAPLPAPAPKPEQPGIMKSIARGVVNPILRTAFTAYQGAKGLANAGQAAFNVAAGDTEGARRNIQEGYDAMRPDAKANIPFFGEITPVGTSGDLREDARDIVATGAEIASTVVGGGAAKQGAKATFKGAVKEAAKQGAKAGAAQGGAQSFGSAVRDQQNSVGQVALRTAAGIGVGAATGLGAGVVGAATSASVRKVAGKAASVVRRAAPAANDTVDEAALLAARTPDSRVATKALDSSGEVVTDPVAREAVRQGIPEADVALIRTAKPADRTKMSKMLDIRLGQTTNKRVTARATDVVGDTFVRKIAKPIETLNRRAGKQLDEVARSLAGQRTDLTPALGSLSDALERAGVQVTPTGKLNFKNSNFEGLRGVQQLIANVWSRAQRVARSGDALQAHRMKSYIDEVVNYGKQAEGLSGKAQTLLKSFRRELDSILDAQFPEYNTVNTVYAETIQQLEQMSAVIGRKFKPGDTFADAQAGLAMRHILSNTKSRAEVLQLLDGMQAVAKKYGIKIDEDIITQANFADLLEKMLGSEAPTSFLGQIDRSMTQAQEAVGATADLARGNVVGGTIKAGKFAVNVLRGVNEKRKIQVLRQLLKVAAR